LRGLKDERTKMKKGQKDERDLNRIPATAELKTRPSDDNVNEFLEAVSDPLRRSDTIALQTLPANIDGIVD
jgi:hypothetical protein